MPTITKLKLYRTSPRPFEGQAMMECFRDEEGKVTQAKWRHTRYRDLYRLDKRSIRYMKHVIVVDNLHIRKN